MKILLDMDGVIADFVGHFCNTYGVSNPYVHEKNLGCWDIARVMGLSNNQFWSRCTLEFWETIPKTEEADNLVLFLEDRFGRKNISLLSSPGIDPSSMVGKHRWIETHFPQFSRRFLFGPAKEFAASNKRLLIDDADHNVDSFKEEGGHTHLFARRWNSAHEHSNSAFQRLVDHVESLQSN